jgi:hypothetical protein
LRSRFLMIAMLILLSVSPLSSASGPLVVAIQDYDSGNNFTGCWWDHCKEKANELAPLLQRLIVKDLQKRSKRELRVVGVDEISDGLMIRIYASVGGGSGRGYAEVAAGLATLGAAPTKSVVYYEVTYESLTDGSVARTDNMSFQIKRNDSIFKDQKEYAEKAAKRIAVGAVEHLTAERLPAAGTR